MRRPRRSFRWIRRNREAEERRGGSLGGDCRPMYVAVVKIK